MSRRAIKDWIAELPISRQRKWQLRQQEAGLCTLCNQPAVTKHYCEFHRLKAIKKHKMWHAANREHHLATMADWRARNPDYNRNYYRKHKPPPKDYFVKGRSE